MKQALNVALWASLVWVIGSLFRMNQRAADYGKEYFIFGNGTHHTDSAIVYSRSEIVGFMIPHDQNGLYANSTDRSRILPLFEDIE
jgi:hypothetical protein